MNRTPSANDTNLISKALPYGKLRGGYFGATAGGFTLFLIPQNNLDIDRILDESVIDVRLHYLIDDERKWFVESERFGPLFSFALPKDLFNAYKKANEFTAESAADMKSTVFREIQLLVRTDNHVKVLVLRLDRDWISEVQAELREAGDDSD